LAVLVYQARPRDPVALAGVVVGMALLGLLGRWIPTQRALAVTPLRLVMTPHAGLQRAPPGIRRSVWVVSSLGSAQAGQFHQLVIRPRLAAADRKRAHGFHGVGIDGCRALPPFAPHISQHTGDLLVAQFGANWRHQANRALFPVQENARR